MMYRTLNISPLQNNLSVFSYRKIRKLKLRLQNPETFSG
jgi:hypothetical protein